MIVQIKDERRDSDTLKACRWAISLLEALAGRLACGGRAREDLQAYLRDPEVDAQ